MSKSLVVHTNRCKEGISIQPLEQRRAEEMKTTQKGEPSLVGMVPMKGRREREKTISVSSLSPFIRFYSSLLSPNFPRFSIPRWRWSDQNAASLAKIRQHYKLENLHKRLYLARINLESCRSFENLRECAEQSNPGSKPTRIFEMLLPSMLLVFLLQL